MIARLLGAEKFGIFSVTLAMISLVEVPLIVRGSEVALRKLGECVNRNDSQSMRQIANAMLRYDMVLFTSTFVVMAIVATAISSLYGLDPWLFMILSLSIPVQAGLGVFKSYFTIYGKVFELIKFELAYTIILACLNLLGIFLLGIYGLAVSLVLANLIKTLLAYVLSRKFVPKLSVNVTGADYRYMITSEGGLSIVRNLFSNGINQVDIILLGIFQKPEIVGLYKVGKSLASIPIKISFPAWRYLQPRLLAANQQNDYAREKRLIVSGSVLLAVVLLLFAAPAYLLGEAAIVLIYGDAYRASFEFFLILVVGIWIFHGITGWFKFWVVVTDSRWFGILTYACAFVSLVVLGILFGSTSPQAMAYVVLTVMTAMSIAAYIKVFK